MFLSKKSWLVCSVALSLSATSVSASVELVRDAVRKALVSNPEVQARWHAFKASEEAQEAARGGYLPKLDLTAYGGHEWRDRPASRAVDFNRHGASLTLTQMVYDGFATRDEVARLGHNKLARYYELLGASESTTLEVIRAYQDVSRYQALLALAEANHAEHQRIFAQVQQRTTAGVGPRADLEQATGRLALAESNLYTEMSNLHDVSARYLRIVGELPLANPTPYSLPKDSQPQDVREALEDAYHNSPAFNAALANVQAAEADLAVRKAAFHPRVDLRARQDLGYDVDNIDGRHSDQVVEVVVSYNLYNGGSDAATRRQFREQQRVSEDLRDKECRDIRQNLSIALNDRIRLQQQLQVLDRHQQSIEKVRQAARQQFEIGQRTLLDLLDTENEYFQARRAYTNAFYDLEIAQGQTLFNMGGLMTALEVTREGLPGVDAVGERPQLDANRLCPLEAPLPPSYQRQSYPSALNDNSSAAESAALVSLEVSSYFTPDSAMLGPGAKRQLTALAGRLRHQIGLQRVRVVGHTDSSGNRAYNQVLAEQRARAVRDFLIAKGVAAELIEIQGAGLTAPVANNALAPGRAQNRRVETSVELKAQP